MAAAITGAMQIRPMVTCLMELSCQFQEIRLHRHRGASDGKVTQVFRGPEATRHQQRIEFLYLASFTP